MMITKVENNFGGEAMSKDFGVFLTIKPFFWHSVPMNPTKAAEKVYLGVLQHPTKCRAKILAGKFYLW